MKALGLVRTSKKQIQFELWVQQFGLKKIVKVFLCRYCQQQQKNFMVD